MNSVWVWVVSFSVLGSVPEHGTFGQFETKSDCQAALENRRTEMLRRNKEIVGTCFYTQRATGFNNSK